MNTKKIVQIEDYEQYIGAEAVDRIKKKAARHEDLHVVNINSTYYGGGVAMLLGSMTLLMMYEKQVIVMHEKPNKFGLTFGSKDCNLAFWGAFLDIYSQAW